MMIPWRRSGVLLGLTILTALATAGCGSAGDQLPREPISGTVTFNGQPLASGTIQFQPDSAREGVASGGMISDGRFHVPRAEGPVPGHYKVLIFATPPSQAPGAGDPSVGSAEGGTPALTRARGRVKRDGEIPTRYNIRTTLAAEVNSGEPNTYTFDLKK